MENPTPPITIGTAERSRFGQTINFSGNAVSFDEKGIAAVSEEVKQALLGSGYDLFDPANLPATVVAAAKEGQAGAEELTDAQILAEHLKKLRSLDLNSLKIQARELELPEAIWGTMRKASLLQYLEEQVLAAGEDDSDEDGEEGTEAGEDAEDADTSEGSEQTGDDTTEQA